MATSATSPDQRATGSRSDEQGLVLDYLPRGGARELFLAKDREVLIEGGAGTGKTMAMMHKGHYIAARFPSVRILLVRKVLESLKTGALDTLMKNVNPFVDGVRTYGGSRFLPAQFNYPNGSVIVPAGLDKSEKVMSSEWDVILVNEVTELSESEYEDLTTRLRNNVLPYQQIVSDCNPAGARHWMNRRCAAGKTRRIKSRHEDNPAYWDAMRNDWTPIGREYVGRTLEGLSGAKRERLLNGIWASAEGLVYEFETHMEQRNASIDLTGWRRVMSCDIGGTNPTAILTAFVSGDERVHISSCLYRRGMTASDIVTAISDEYRDHQPDTVFIDPSAKLIKDDLLRLGIPVVGADNRIEEGIRQVQSVLQRGFTCDPDECADLIEEFGMYAYPPNARIETDKPVKDFDHTMDALRYLVVGVTEPVFDLKAFYERETYA